MEPHRLCLILMLAIGLKGSSHDYEENHFSLGKKWVVLVAGSEGWEYYCDQASVAHAYQIVRRNGIPKENIIVMMVNDVVNHTNNPAPGTLINQPNGPDVYKGIKVDYAGSNVTKKNFFSVIKGDRGAVAGIGSGRVVESGPQDNIFINFVSLGNSGTLFLPYEDPIYGDELVRALREMYIRRKYGKMLLYVMSCASGSMFDGLLDDDKSVLAITASGPRDCPWECYCWTEYDTCLGDVFSVTWMENWDKMIVEATTEAAKRTVFKDFQETRTSVYPSDVSSRFYGNVMMYGDFRVGLEKLSSFIGFSYGDSTNNKTKNVLNPLKIGSVVRQQDVAEYTLERQVLNTKDPIKRESLKKEIGHKKNMKKIVDKIMNEIYKKVVKEMPGVAVKIGTLEKPAHLPLNMDMFPCYRSIVNHITEKCFSVSKNRQVEMSIFANICVANEKAHHAVNKFIDVTCSTSLT